MKENGCIPRDRIKLKTELRLRLDKDFWGRQKRGQELEEPKDLQDLEITASFCACLK